MTNDWVLDVTFWSPDSPLAFCPMDNDGGIVVGLTVLANVPPGRMVAVYHADGQQQVDQWMERHPDVLERLETDLRAEGRWPA